MNVHLVNDAPSSGAANKPGRRLYISKVKSPDALWNTLAHEFGHNFNLHHTHRGSCISSENNEDCGNCEQEPVSRTMSQPITCGNFNNSRKCEVNADGFCDTPGEPNMNQYANFNVVDTLSCSIKTIPSNFSDNWGVTWQPDVKNIMSYSWRRCRTKFSYSQVAAMYYEIQSNSKFSFKSTQASGNISGPTLLCPNQTYTFTAPNQLGAPYFLWQIPSGWNIAGQGNQTVQITVPSWSPGDHYIYVNSFSNIYPGSSVAPLKVTFNNSQFAITGPNEIANDGVCRSFYTTNIAGLTYNWTTSAPNGSGITICGGQGTSSISVKASGSAPSFYLNVSTSGVCGIPANGSKYITVNTGGGGGPIARILEEDIFFYPNPSSKFLYVKDKNRADFKIENVYFINIKTGIPDLIIDCVEAAEQIDISKIRPGVYLIQYDVEGKVKTYKIIKQ